MAWHDEDLDLVFTQLGGAVIVVNDYASVIDWLMANFPFPGPGSTCEWTLVPSAKTIAADYSDSSKMCAAFEDMLAHVNAQESDNVIVIWHSIYPPTLAMPLSACRSTFHLLCKVLGDEMHVLSQEGGWYIECDPFFDELHSGRVMSR